VIAVPIEVVVAITVTVPEHAPITIAIVIIIVTRVEATHRAAEAVIAFPATDAPDLLDEAQLVLRRPNIGGAGQVDRIGAVGQQRGADERCGGGQCHQQEPMHFRFSLFLWSGLGQAKISKPENCLRSNDSGPFRRKEQIAAHHFGGDPPSGSERPQLRAASAQNLEYF
jgi:hypothetical protein